MTKFLVHAFQTAVPGTNTSFYDCRLEYSAFSIYGSGNPDGRSNPSSLAASIVGIAVLFLTVSYMW